MFLAAIIENITTESSFSINSLPWEKFPEDAYEACENGLEPTSGNVREIIKILAEYQLNIIKNSDRKVSASIAKFLINTYPKSFCDKIHSDVVGDGVNTFIARLHNKVNLLQSMSK